MFVDAPQFEEFTQRISDNLLEQLERSFQDGWSGATWFGLRLCIVFFWVGITLSELPRDVPTIFVWVTVLNKI